MPRKLFLLFLLLVAIVSAETVKIDENTKIINAVSAVKAYKDEGGGLTVDDFLTDNQATKVKQSNDSLLGISSGVSWFCLDVENVSDKQLSWLFSIPRVNGVGMVYYVRPNGTVEMKSMDELYVFLNHPTIAYGVKSEPGEKGRIVFRLSFSDGGFVYPQFDIYSEEVFHKNIFKHTMFKSITFGAVSVLFLYNLFLLFAFRNQVYVWYSVYMFGVVVFILANSGIGYEFVWHGSGITSKNVYTASYPLMFAAALQFTRVFLRTKERFVIIDKILLAFAALFVALLFFALLGYREGVAKIFMLSSFAMSLLPFVGAYFWRAGYKEARFYTLAWSVWAVCMIPLMMLFAGAEIRYESVAMSTRFALVCEAVLLSFALADQIKILRAQRDEAVAKCESQKEMLDIQSRLAQMGEMIAAIGHQWKQPINLIMLYIQDIQYMAKQCSATCSKEICDELEKLRDIVLNMSSTLDDFKNFFSPSKSKKIFSPIATIRNVLGMVGKQYEHENIAIQIEGDESVRLFGRENELKQVVVNIFNNARDVFIQKGMGNRQILVTISRADAHVHIDITDNAGGIPSDVIDKIFDQYYTTKGALGTGIGLHICKRIVESGFGGEIVAKNSGEGACFCLILPAANDEIGV